MKYSLCALILFLTGCTTIAGRGSGGIAGLVEKDLTRAAEIAGKHDDQIAAKCFAYLASVVKEGGALQEDAAGIFSLLEKARLLRRGANKDHDKFRLECGPLAADLMILFVQRGASGGVGF